jgi:hypothetical protein
VGRAGAFVGGNHDSVFDGHLTGFGLEARRSAPSSHVRRLALARGYVRSLHWLARR